MHRAVNLIDTERPKNGKKKKVYLLSLMMKVPDHVYVLG
jgi:hypothetical protein